MFDIKEVGPTDPNFIQLTQELSAVLAELTSDSGESSFESGNMDTHKDGVLVAFTEGEPVACGVIRYHSKQRCELKRMYSKRPGGGHFLLTQLEKMALEKGYTEVILSTRRVNTKAVEFYLRHDYREIGAYGKYLGVDRSICLGKSLAL